MKLVTLRDGSRDGALCVVDKALKQMTSAAAIAPNLQAALDSWEAKEPALRELAQALEAGKTPRVPFDAQKLMAPLPRVYDWVDGSSFLNHVLLVRKARKAAPPEGYLTDPLIYQGGGSEMLAPHADIPVDEAWGPDFESEVAVILGDTPRGTRASEANRYVRLLLIVNDVSLRNLIPAELAKGFGFFQSKPATALAPVVCTPDELGPAWRDGRIHRPLETWHNGVRVGNPDAGKEMHFSFFELMEHICKTRSYTAGTILGSGTVSNEDPSRGYSCIAEKRMLEIIADGEPKTPFLRYGDTVEIEMFAEDKSSLFGRIHQRVRKLDVSA